MSLSGLFGKSLTGIVLLLTIATVNSRANSIPVVAAAADLQFALTAIAAQFEADTGRKVSLVFGSSGNFTHQIAQGGPFELFLSADENYIFRLHALGKTRDQGSPYAVGRVGLFTPHGSRLKAEADLDDLRKALAEGRIKRFAIANPEHAPYGRAAREVLHTAGLWDLMEKYLVYGENAAQTTQFAASGTAQGGIIPLSLALAPQIAERGHFALLSAELHYKEPLRQRMALTTGAGNTAEQFYDYLRQPAAQAIFVRYGFILPEKQAD